MSESQAGRGEFPDPNSVSDPAPSSTGPPTSAAFLEELQKGEPVHHASALEIWLHRVGALMFVFLCAVTGVLLVVLPWRPEWTDNPLLLRYPEMRALISSGFVRGVASGLGVLDIWIGFWEALHYHEDLF